MSNPKQSLFHGWRARTFYLTRNRDFLLRTAGSIVALGLALACLAVLGNQEQAVADQGRPTGRSEAEIHIHQEFHALRVAADPQPRRLALLLRHMLSQLSLLTTAAEEGTPPPLKRQSLTELLTIGEFDLTQLLEKHAQTPVLRDLFDDYLRVALSRDEEAWKRMQSRAAQQPPPMLASELCGSLYKRMDDLTTALSSFYAEGLNYADAKDARSEAVHLALKQKDAGMLKQMLAQPGWLQGCSPLLQVHAGALLGDIWLQWSGLVSHRLLTVPYGLLALALLASGLWYIILTQHSAHEPWRWLRPLPAVFAGGFSVWPTLTLLAWQEVHQGLTEATTFPQDVIYFVLGVGLREEGCKLAVFAFFLPWLLWRRQGSLALLTGAFVGLGFALVENVGYYEDYGGSIAWTRSISANFLHISLTGLCGHSLYRMLRTRFARADECLATLAMAVVAHGLYDWLNTTMIIREGPWLAMVVLVLTVSRFLDVLAQETQPSRLTVSPRAVFILGSALLIAASLIMGGFNSSHMAGIADVGTNCLSMVPIAILYWRKFEHV